jgi:tetratricopeptide (TPR) repeat protein
MPSLRIDSRHSNPNAPDLIRDRWWLLLLGYALLAGLIFAAYYNTFQVPYLLDDADSIEKNKTIRSFASALFPPTNSGITVSGRPLLNLTLALNYILGGTAVLGYHIGNLLIHFGAALALFGVVRRTLQLPSMRERYGAHATLLAWFSAAIWALHPLQTESVTYIIQRAESLVGLCYLFTLYAFIRAVEKPSRVWTVMTIGACALGMAAKEVMASAPLVIFLYDRTFVSGTFRESWRRHCRLHLGLAAGWILLGALVITSGGRGTSVGFARISSWDYLLTQASAIVRYLRLSFLPNDLVFDYGPTVEKTPAVLIRSTLILAPLLAATFFALKKRPVAGFLGASFFLILAPTSSVVPIVTQTIAEHRMYLPLAAIVVGAVLLIYRANQKYYSVVLLVLAVVLGVGTVYRNKTYQSSLSIWEDTVSKMPDNIRALNNLGVVYLEKDRLDEAITRLSEALDLVPNFSVSCCNLGRALVFKAVKDAGLEKSTENLADGIEFGQKRTSVADLATNEKVKAGLALLERAIQMDPENAGYAAYYGNALLALREPEAAVQQLERAASLEPENRNAHYDLANALSRLDRNEKAAEHFQIVLRLQPNDAEALTNYGALLRRMGRFPESIENLQTALKLKPNAARVHSNLGVSFLESGRTVEGTHQLEEALRLDPYLPQARYNLSNALADAGQTEEAITHLEALLKIAPPTAELLSNLGVLYARVSRLDDAVKQMQRALELDPTYEAAQENLAKINAYIRSHPIK